MFTGDAEQLVENNILNKGADVRADVLKLGHHMEVVHLLQTILQKVNPEYAIAMCEKEILMDIPIGK